MISTATYEASIVPAAEPAFEPVNVCWICDGRRWSRVNRERFELSWVEAPSVRQYDQMSYWIRRCEHCGFMQPEVLPSAVDYFDGIYDQKWPDWWMEQEFRATQKDLIFRTILEELAARVAPQQRTLLDIGAHVGRMIWLAQQAGWKSEGIELNPRTAACAVRMTGLPVHRQNAQQMAARERRFGAVTLTDVLEHIPSPRGILETVRQLLHPGGWVSVKVPCGRNQLMKERLRRLLRLAPEVAIGTNLVHVNHFTPGSLRLALERSGFVDVVLTLGAPELPPPSWRAAVIGSRLLRRGVYAAGRLLPGGVYTPLALNLQAFARNPN